MRITITVLLLIILFISDTVIAEQTGKLTPPAEAVTDITYMPHIDNWGWHVIHKEAPRRFLSDTSILRRTDVCVKCHVQDEYKIFDPHKQRNAKGEIMGEKCLYCHVENPVDVLDIPFTGEWGWHLVHKETPKKLLKELSLQSVCFKCHAKDKKVAAFKEIEIIKNSTTLCEGCHGKGYSPAHPANANHLLKPSRELSAMMAEGEKKLDIMFPLDHNGKLTCVTCHNPHEKGILPAGMIGAEGAGKGSLLRLPTEGDKICVACHRDKARF